MKLNNTSLKSLLSISLALTPFTTVSADTFHLNDGTVIEGTIISETKRSYLLRAEVSRNVYDEKTILKLDVTKYIKADPAAKDFKKLSGIIPTADLLSAKALEKIIDTKLKPFIKKYPDSDLIIEAQEMLKVIENEHKEVLAGGLKIDGVLLNAKEVSADKYEVSANMDLKKFITSVQKKQYRLALSKLDKMEELYPNSTQLRKAQKVAIGILPHYQRELKILLNEVEEISKRRDTTLSTMSPSDRRRTEEIFARQDQSYQDLLATIMAERSSQWLPISAFHKDPIQKNLSLVSREIERLTIDSRQPVMMASALYRTTLQALEDGDLPKALELHKQFKSEKPSKMFSNDLADKVSETTKVLEELAKKKAEEMRLAKIKQDEEDRIAKEKADLAKKIADEKNDRDHGSFLNSQRKKQEQIESLKQ